MAHGGEEAALGLVGRVGGLTGFFQSGRVFDMPGHVMQCTQPGILALVTRRDEGQMQMTPVDLQISMAGLAV
ncbi:hypothetical protein D3C81_1248380 [compost metagenome]